MKTDVGTSLAMLLEELMQQKQVDKNGVAQSCKVTYQTVKNVLDGKSVNVKFLMNLINAFKLEQDPIFLRRLLIAFLEVQFPDDKGKTLLNKAGLLGESVKQVQPSASSYKASSR